MDENISVLIISFSLCFSAANNICLVMTQKLFKLLLFFPSWVEQVEASVQHSVPQKKWPKFSFSLNADYCRLNEVAHNSSYSIQGRRNQSFHRLSATGLFYKLYG